MILLEKDNIIIDVEKWQYYTTTNGPIDHDAIPEAKELFQIILNFSLQINGKLRRATITATVEKGWEGHLTANRVFFKNMNELYVPFDIIKSLWYDVPAWVELHKMADKILLELF